MTPLPRGLKVVLDPSVRRISTTRLAGGSPRRLLTLSPAGGRALQALERGRADSVPARVLGRRLVDAGIAHPRPSPRAPGERVTVVIPVHDRPEQLARCLGALEAGAQVLVVDDGSRDAAAVAAVAAKHRARLIRRGVCGGPAAARNTALEATESELLAFLDSDCVPGRDWLAQLIGHFEDPLVGAVAPRVRAAEDRKGPLGSYLASRSPLDMGGREAAVRPGQRVAYVPTAALLVRRLAVGAGFDQDLRYGEDVDFVWRLHDAGWRVRYDPRVAVAHAEPATLGRALVRRFRYGTSASMLCARHRRRLAPLVLGRAPSLAAALLLGRRPRAAAALLLVSGAAFTVRHGRRGLPRATAARWFVEAGLQAGLSLIHYTETVGLPLALATAGRRRRPALVGLLALPALLEWASGERELDPLRWTVLALADDGAYAAGVWWGCLMAREHRPLLPKLAW